MKNNQQTIFKTPFGKPFGNVLLTAVMAVLGAFMTSCGGGTSSAPQHVKLIPKDAPIVIAFDVKQMVSKSVSFEDLFSQKSLEAMGANEKEAKEGANDAKKFMNSGVDYLNIGYMFAENENNKDFVIAIPLDDVGKFEKFLKAEKTDVKTEGNIKYAVYKEFSFIAWKDKNALVFMNRKGKEEGLKKRATTLLELKDEQTLLANNKNFTKVLGNKSDIQIWIDSEKYARMNGETTQFQGVSLKDNFVSVSVKFEKGEVIVDADTEMTPAIAKIYNKILKSGGIDAKLTKNVPTKKPVLVASLALNLKGIKEIMQERGALALADSELAKSGVTIDEIINILSGDILIVAENINIFNGLKVMACVGVNDEKAFHAALIRVGKGDITKTGDVYVSKEDDTAQLIVKNGVAYLATENYIKAIQAGKGDLESDLAKSATANTFFAYAGEGITKQTIGDVDGLGDVFESATFKSGELKDKSMNAKGVVKMKEKSKNSLLVLVDALKNAKPPKKEPIRAPIESDEPDAIDETKQSPAKQQ